MISVTATEFQQRTGYYFDLVDKGVEVEIRKMKPKNQVFKLTKGRVKKGTLLNDLEKFMSDEVVEDSIKFQNRVRS
jgi:hypothetical protein